MTTVEKNERATSPRVGADQATSASRTGDPADQPLRQIQIALGGLRYGTVTAVVHDGVVVQVERTERVRMGREGRSE
jgi:hypothetical protein